MTTPFGPRLIGETEKTLNALLRSFLAGTDLTEPQWVTPQLALELDGDVDPTGLADALSDRAHFENAAHLVDTLTDRDLLEHGRPTTVARDLVASIRHRITHEAGTIWQGLPQADVDAATNVLNEVVARARAVLVNQGPATH